MNEQYLCDKDGNRITPAQGGMVVTAIIAIEDLATKGTDYTETVVSGTKYLITASPIGSVYGSFTSAVTTLADVEFVIPAGKSIIVTATSVLLHLSSDVATAQAIIATV